MLIFWCLQFEKVRYEMVERQGKFQRKMNESRQRKLDVLC